MTDTLYPEILEAKAAELEDAANWLREPFSPYKDVAAAYSRAPKEAAEMLRQAAAELRKHRGARRFGDDRVFVDIRAAVVNGKGEIVRTLNGTPITPGTSLFIRSAED